MGSKNKTIAPPDPVVTANAQAQANMQTAEQQQKLNMIGTVGPQGTTGYRPDPTQPGGFTQYTNLSPQEQQTYDLTKAAENAALGVAGQQIGRVGDALGRPLDLSTLPGMQSSVGGQQMQTTFGMGGPLQYGFDPGQAVQGQVGGDLNAARQQAIDAAYGQATSRLDPQFAQREESLRVQLANQGLAPGSVAWEREMSQLGRDRSDAYNQATYGSIGAGEQMAQALFARQLGQGQFANQARQQALQEQAYVQNQPLNQFSALMGLSQVGMPTGVQYTPTQVAPTDVLGAYALNQQAQQANANRAASSQSGLMGGLFQLGSAAILASDVRLKTDIKRVGALDNGVPVYSYRYKAGGPPMIGVMAQDLAGVRPDLVHDIGGGMLGVNYGGL